MNRRGFLYRVLGAAVLPFVPKALLAKGGGAPIGTTGSIGVHRVSLENTPLDTWTVEFAGATFVLYKNDNSACYAFKPGAECHLSVSGVGNGWVRLSVSEGDQTKCCYVKCGDPSPVARPMTAPDGTMALTYVDRKRGMWIWPAVDSSVPDWWPRRVA